MAELPELARPVMGAGAGLRRQRGDEVQELGERDVRVHQRGLARFIDAVNGKDVLCQIDATDTIAMDFPFQQTSELMRVRASHSGTWMPYPAIVRIIRDGEVPFIR